MKNKMILVLLTGAMLLGTGCGADTNADTENTNESSEVISVVESASEEESNTEPETEFPEYTALDYVTLGEYKGLDVTLLSEKVTDEDIDAYIKDQLEENDLLEETEDAIEEGDTVNLDYTASQNGEVIEDGGAEDYDLVVGDGTFLTDFENNLVGAAAGDKLEFTVTFPEDEAYEEYAGKDVDFEVTINSVKRAPALTDDLVASFSDYSTLADYTAYVTDVVTEQKKEQRSAAEKASFISQLMETSTISEYPQEMVDYFVNQDIANLEYYAEYYDYDLDDYLEEQYGMTEDEYKESMTTYYKESVISVDMLLKAIAETEEIELTEDEYQAKLEEYAESVDASVDDLISTYTEPWLRSLALQDVVIEFLEENANITDPDQA